MYFQHEGNGAIIKDDWKLVRRFKKDWELFEIQKDPTELNDLSLKDTLKRNILVGEYRKWEREYGVLPWPLKTETEKK
jgi:arylsulfatase